MSSVDDIFSRVYGAGENCIVFLHGFTLDHAMWDAQLAHFSGAFRVIAIDLPGHGQSPITTPPDIHEATIKIRRHVQNLTKNCRSLFVCGLSLGGYFALEYAQCFSQDLNGLILANTELRSDNITEQEKRDFMIAKITQGEGSEMIAAVNDRLLAKESETHHPHLKLKLRTQMDLCPSETLIFGLKLMRARPNYSQTLAGFSLPTLAIGGQSDQLCSPKDFLQIQQVFRNVETHLLPETGHLSCMEKPGEFNKLMGDFIAKHINVD